MSAYKIANLKEIEDSADKFGYAPHMEARFGRGPLEAERSGISYQRLSPNFRGLFGHRHAEQEETYVVVGGSARVKLEDGVHELRTWDAIRLAPSSARGFEAGPEGMELLVFGAGPGGEAELLHDWWPTD